jgi:hypothetical protein
VKEPILAGQLLPDLALEELIGHHPHRELAVHILASLAAKNVRVVLGLEKDHARGETTGMLRIVAERERVIGHGGH